MSLRFFRYAPCLASLFILSAAHADAIKSGGVCTDDIYTNCASVEVSNARRTALKQFHDEVIVDRDVRNAEKITYDAIRKSARKFRWRVIKDTPSALRLQLNIRRHRAIIDITIKGGSVDADYVDSVNLNYEKDAAGNESIHPNYHSWVQNLLNFARKSAKSAARH
jgi:hypothetical protein